VRALSFLPTDRRETKERVVEAIGTFVTEVIESTLGQATTAVGTMISRCAPQM
jgi:hypothetical protein